MIKRIFFAIILIIGLIFVYLGYEQATSVGSRISTTLTGRYSPKIMSYCIGGGIASLLGLLGIFKKI